MTGANVTLVTCWKCAGTGNLPHMKHVDDGVCFNCDGSGKAEPRARRAVRISGNVAPLPLTVVRRIYAEARDEGKTFADVQEAAAGLNFAMAIAENAAAASAFADLGWDVAGIVALVAGRRR